MKAIIIGATGATGSLLLDILLEDKNYHQVDVFVRREFEIEHPKLTVHTIDFSKPEQWQHLVSGNVLFSCLGTTLKDAGSKEKQWVVDFEYQYNFAKAASENNVENYILVSSGYASSKSMFYYSKMKGKLEDEVKKLQFQKKCIIFQPPLLLRANKSRKSEIIGEKIIRVLNKVGLLIASKPLPTHILAKAMVSSVQMVNEKIHTIEGQDILNYAKK